MSVELHPGDYTVDSKEREFFDWLETDLRNRQELIDFEDLVKEHNPVLYRIIAGAAAELAPGDPVSHATYFGSFLLLTQDIEVTSAEVDDLGAGPAATLEAGDLEAYGRAVDEVLGYI